MPFAGDPVYASDVETIEDYTTERPLVRLVQQANQSIPDATLTALTFGAGSEEIETTAGFHDTVTNNSRITPTVAGYYRFSGVYHTGIPTTLVSIDASFRKNGVTSIPSGTRGFSGSALAQAAMASCIQSMNGTTDYMELMAFQDSAGAANTNVSSRFTSFFECEFLRPL